MPGLKKKNYFQMEILKTFESTTAMDTVGLSSEPNPDQESSH